MKRLFQAPAYSVPADLALLLMRFIAGIAFMFHGWGKIQNPFGWMGPEGAPGIFQALAAIAEFGGGFAWIIGLLTPLASFGIFCTMVVAASLHAFILGDPFVSTGEGGAYEPAAVYLGLALVLMTIGPGRFSLDRLIFGPKSAAPGTPQG